MLDELVILKTVAERLNKSNIPYMISGSVAMNYYAQPRMTRDIDIVVDLRFPDIETFYNLFKDDFYMDLDMVKTAVKNRGMFNIIHSGELVKIDFIVCKAQEFRKNELERRKKFKISDFETYFVSIEDLILSKLIWAKPSHSEMQLKDIKNLVKQEVDIDYIKKWAGDLDVADLLEEVLSE